MSKDANPRIRLLETLDSMSSKHNVLSIGVNTLLQEAGVARASLYDHFGSKEALIVAWLDQQQGRWFGWFNAYLATHSSPADPERELDAAFGYLETWLARDDFAGCPFVTVYLQLRDAEHPAGQQARQYATRLHEFFKQRLTSLGARQPTALATSYLELFLGAIVVQQLGVGKQAARAARRSARRLLECSLDSDAR